MITSRTRKGHNETLSFYSKNILKLLVFIVFLITLHLLYSKFKTYFPIKSVSVYGAQHMDRESMQQAVMPLVNKGFFAVDVDSIKDRLLQSPWVSSVVVQRTWPNKVLITIVERSATARWNNSSLLSDNGEIFNPEASSYPEGIPQLIGAEGQQLEVLQHYKKLNRLLSILHFKIARLELTPEHAWSVALDNGMKLNIGYKDVLTRMSHFVKVYPKIIGNKNAEVDTIDLRYSNGLAVKWKTIT
jgi:cell division protein FtsQ